MKLVTTKKELDKIIEEEHAGLHIGLVPTMGNLHLGHLSLAEASLAQTDKTIVTIFVNPKQFGENEDFGKYPRTLERDLKLLKKLEGSENITVFAPQNEKEIYPDQFNTTIEVKGLDHALCGLHRPGHFKGVTTVVYQLFKITKADTAFFGQKDYQQFRIIEKMVEDLDLPIKLSMQPIIREASGLAMSSRNQYMSEEQKSEAALINKTLYDLKEIFLKDRLKANAVREKILFEEPRWQYLEILDAHNLKDFSDKTTKVIVAGAFTMGDTRLIDNILFSL